VNFKKEILRGSFSTAQVARLTGLSARQLDHWDRLGFLRPSLAPAAGYGSSRRYSFGDLVRVRLAARLRAAGFGLKKIRQLVQTLARLDPSRAGLEDSRLLVADSRVIWVKSERELVDLVSGGQLMLVFPVSAAVRDMASAVERLSQEPELDLIISPVRQRKRHSSS
jgi:DNA-binding transcriptional MerR regulator